jgi:hypothetical protein
MLPVGAMMFAHRNVLTSVRDHLRVAGYRGVALSESLSPTPTTRMPQKKVDAAQDPRVLDGTPVSLRDLNCIEVALEPVYLPGSFNTLAVKVRDEAAASERSRSSRDGQI